MKYISIGAVLTEGTEYRVTVCRGNNKFTLTGEQTSVWLNGRKGFANAKNSSEQKILNQLTRMGLALKSEDFANAEYWTLTQCTIVPADRKYPYWGISGLERTVLQWLREAGLVLSMAELVYLVERKIPIRHDFLGSRNAQRLVEQIYTKDTIFDNILENQMEHASARDQTVNAVLNLLRKKRIVLL